MRQADNFRDYISAFEKKLEPVTVERISPENYCRNYLSHLIQHRKFFLAVYADILNKLAAKISRPKNELSIIDYGTGNGLLGIFAKFCGFEKVFLNDIDQAFLKASETLAAELGVHVDGFIPGEIADVRSAIPGKKIDAVIGTDVIEHIYDPDHFFGQLHEMNPAMVTIFSTASNPSNFMKVKSLRKMQLKDELLGSDPSDRLLAGHEAHEAFLVIREKIIREAYSALPGKDISRLATLTRGMNKEDIIKAVDRFRLNGRLPVPAAGTNTCHPLTGSWTERILSLQDYRAVYNRAGFNVEFFNGFYDVYGDGFKIFAKKMLNNLIPVLGRSISPYIVIAGSKK